MDLSQDRIKMNTITLTRHQLAALRHVQEICKPLLAICISRKVIVVSFRLTSYLSTEYIMDTFCAVRFSAMCSGSDDCGNKGVRKEEVAYIQMLLFLGTLGIGT